MQKASFRRPTTAQTVRPRLQQLEARDVPAVATPHNLIAVGSGAGQTANVRVYDNAGTFKVQFNAYPGFFGGVNVAVADVNNDGKPDVITGAGPGGGPHVKVFDGAAIANNQVPTELPGFTNLFAYGVGFTGGVNVAGGDIDGDGKDDIITGPGAGGGPHVKVFSGANPTTLLVEAFPYPVNFQGGVRVAAGDLGGDATTAEIVTGAGPGGGPHVQAFNYTPGVNEPGVGTNITRFASFQAYSEGFSGGVYVAVGNVSNNRDASNNLYSDIIVGAGSGGGPQVLNYRLLDATKNSAGKDDWKYFLSSAFYAYNDRFGGGVRVATVDRNGLSDIITGAGPGGGPHVRRWSQNSTVTDQQVYTSTELGTGGFFPFDPTYLGGVFVG